MYLPDQFFTTKHKAAIAEAAIRLDLLRRGFQVYTPSAEAGDADLVLERIGHAVYTKTYARSEGLESPGVTPGQLERVQVKYSRSDGTIIKVRYRVHSVTAGRVSSTKVYTSDDIDWMGIYDPTSNSCYYVPASELDGKGGELYLRLSDPVKGHSDIRWAKDYQSI